MQSTKIAILGATGAVGQEFLRLLAERDVPAANIRLLASARSAGKTMAYGTDTLTVQEVSADAFNGIDIALFSAGGSTSKQWAQVAIDAGARVVDNSSAFRMTDGVPLVIPEVNPQAIGDAPIIANPNCSTIIMNMVVWPLHQVVPVERIVVSTYQAASGAGQQAMIELETQTADILAGKAATPTVFPVQSAFNLFSHNSDIDADGYNIEEVKMIKETRKIFGDPNIKITATCVRVPVPRAHSESINLELSAPMTADRAREILSKAPGVKVVDDRVKNYFPMPIDASGKDDCLVGHIRRDISRDDERGLDLFVCGDQIRKGAALNAVQIAELIAG